MNETGWNVVAKKTDTTSGWGNTNMATKSESSSGKTTTNANKNSGGWGTKATKASSPSTSNQNNMNKTGWNVVAKQTDPTAGWEDTNIATNNESSISVMVVFQALYSLSPDWYM